MVGWVNSAWEDMQLSRPDWYWMQYEFSLTLAQGVRSYSPTDAGITERFSSWNTDSLRLYRTDKSDETGLPFMPYSDFRSTYLTGQIIETEPIVFTVDPRLNLLMGPMPDGLYRHR
jgi:hypothetical protein